MARISARAKAVALIAVFCFALVQTPLAHAATTNPKIKHVVVLMLENRSFDHMVGMLKGNNSAIDGCAMNDANPKCANPVNPLDPESEVVAVDNEAVYVQPADPSHSVGGTAEQVYGYGPIDPSEPAPMTGFIMNYNNTSGIKANNTVNGTFIMKCFDPTHVPAITTLASEFALFDQWHCAVPGPTEVNRAFANSATSYGYAANQDIIHHLGMPQRTIWENLVDAGEDWAVYMGDFASTMLFRYTWLHLDHIHSMKDFYKDASNGDLPAYTWLEPKYYDLFGDAAQDEHPDHDVAEGEKLIADVYAAVRNSPLWNETLFMVTYDEHGGFFDHVSPPAQDVPNPDGRISTNPPFNFTRLGVRVPTIVASPYVPKGTVVHSAAQGEYCHSSIPATLKKLFAPEADFLTHRDAWAATFDDVLSLDEPREDCPHTLPTPLSHREYGKLPALDGKMPVSDLQRFFTKFAGHRIGDHITDADLDAMNEGQAGRYTRNAVNKFVGRKVV